MKYSKQDGDFISDIPNTIFPENNVNNRFKYFFVEDDPFTGGQTARFYLGLGYRRAQPYIWLDLKDLSKYTENISSGKFALETYI